MYLLHQKSCFFFYRYFWFFLFNKIAMVNDLTQMNWVALHIKHKKPISLMLKDCMELEVGGDDNDGQCCGRTLT